MVEVIDHRAELLFIKSAVWDFAEYVGVHYPEIVEEFNHSQNRRDKKCLNTLK